MVGGLYGKNEDFSYLLLNGGLTSFSVDLFCFDSKLKTCRGDGFLDPVFEKVRFCC